MRTKFAPSKPANLVVTSPFKIEGEARNNIKLPNSRVVKQCDEKLC